MRPFVDIKTITADNTLITAGGGEPKDFNSVKFALFKVFKACWAASSAGSAFFKSLSQSTCLIVTVLVI